MNKIAKKYNVFLSGNVPIDETKYTNYIETYNKNESRYEGSFIGSSNLPLILDQNVQTCNFVIHTHYDSKQKKINSTTQNNPELNLFSSTTKLHYNFYIKNFENNINELKVTSLQVPNYYNVVENFPDKKFDKKTFFENRNIFLSSQEAKKTKENIFNSNLFINNKSITLDKYLKNVNSQKELFPYYTQINIPTHPKPVNNISDIFNKYNIYRTILYAVSVARRSTKVSVDNKNNIKSYSTLDFDQPFLDYILYSKSSINLDFIFDINSRIDSKSRDMRAILNNASDYTEVIGYHIRKYENNNKPTDTKSGKPIQEWYVPNVGEEEIEIIDSQLIYANEYTYTIDPIVLTFINIYNISKESIGNNLSRYSFTRIPKIKIFDFNRLGSSYGNTLTDSPPLEPEIDFIPYVGVPNKIKISLNTAIGKKTVKPVSFTSKEVIKNEILIKSQDKNTSENLLTYVSDDSSKIFEIYRLDAKPNSYLDFVGSTLATLETNNESAISYVDTINQNKKYYYIARCYDMHGNVSNPTELYEVEIVNDNGLILPYINVIDINSTQVNGTDIKEIKRFLKLKPALRHTQTDSINITPNDLKLGLSDIGVWDKKFKVRVTSKSTGRKMDVYLTFKYVKKEG